MTCHTWAEEKKQGKERENLRGDKERGEGGLNEEDDGQRRKQGGKESHTDMFVNCMNGHRHTRKEDRGGKETGVCKWKIRR